MEDESQPYAPKCAYMRPISPISAHRSSVAPVFDPTQAPTHLTVSPVHHHASAMQESAFSPAHFVDFAAKAWSDLLMRAPSQAVLNPISPVHPHPTGVSMSMNESTPPQPFTSSLAHDVTLPAPVHTPSSTSSLVPQRRFYFTPPNYSPVSPFAKATPFVPSPLGAEEDSWHVPEGSVSPVAPRMALLNRYRSGGSDHIPSDHKPVPIPHTHAQHAQHPLMMPSVPLQRQRSALSQVFAPSSPLSSLPESSSKGSSKGGDSPSPTTSETDALGHIDAEGSVIASSSQDHDASTVEEDAATTASQEILSASIPISNASITTAGTGGIVGTPDPQADDHMTRSSLAALAAAAASIDTSVPLRWRRKPIPDPEPDAPAPRRNQKRAAAGQPESSSAVPKRVRLQREARKPATSASASTTKQETKSARAASAKEKKTSKKAASTSSGSKKTTAAAAAANKPTTTRKKKEPRPPVVQESDDDGGADGGQSSSSSAIEGLSTAESLSPTGQRIFPPTLLINTKFPAFYKRYHVVSYYRPSDDDKVHIPEGGKNPGGNYNHPRDEMDLYTPRFVKGVGKTKVGCCPICLETPERGGENKALWLSMKFSAYNYHMQYSHGISATDARPFSPPVAFKTAKRQAQKNERPEILQGKCHKCAKYIAIESVKAMDTKQPELFWWKHAAACHQGSKLQGESGTFVEDEYYTNCVARNGGSS